MNEINILYSIKENFYKLVLGFYNQYVSNKTSMNLQIYKRNLALYNKINICNNFKELKSCLKDISNEISILREHYSKKVEEYNNFVDKKSAEAKNVFSEIKCIAGIAQSLTDVYSEIKIEISKVSKKQNIPVIIQGNQEDKTSANDVDFNNETIYKLDQLNKKILSLKEKNIGFDYNSKDAIQIRREINSLSTVREKIIYDTFGYDGVNYLRNIESLELRYASASDVRNSKPYSISHNDYISKLDELIHIIADLKFYGINSKYISVDANSTVSEKFNVYKDTYTKYMSMYMNLVGSLYQNNNPIIYSGNDYMITSSDLMSYLSIYNITGGYQDFKLHHKTGKIGNEAISKEMYSEGVDNIEKFIKSFKEKSSELINSKGGNIIIRDVSPNKYNLKNELDDKITNLYRMVMEKSKGGSQSM